MAMKVPADAIRARLSEYFTAAPILGVNAAMQPPADGGPWVRITFPVASNKKTTLGRNYRENASALIRIATQIGDGLETSGLWCEQIATIFRGQKFGGVDCAFAAPSINEGRDEGSYWIASVIVPYRYDYSDA